MIGRRLFLSASAVSLALARRVRAASPPYRIAFANINDAKDVRIEGLGFTGYDVRRSFELAARGKPVEVIYYDNGSDAETAVSNAADAIGKKVDLLIEFNSQTEGNDDIARKAAAAGVPVLAIGYKVGGAPLYSADNLLAGQIGGRALVNFAKQSWPDETPMIVILGDLGDPTDIVGLRIKGITETLRQGLPTVQPTMLDTGGQPQRGDGLLAKFLQQNPHRRVLVATLDDPTAVWAKAAIDLTRRADECVVVSQGLDRSIHGGASEKKEIDPANRASPVLGSVAYFMDRYGFEVLPLALRMLQGEAIPEHVTTRHVLITATNVFREYPPIDMN
ncbi:MAG: sugar ABC transporter substrate-binding protein [Rhodopila sp.]